MCGRYFIDTLPETIGDAFDLIRVPKLEVSYNVAPTQLQPIVLAAEGERRLGPARWGLIPFWAKDAKIGNRMINARSETVASKPAFRQSWQKRRCLVPASGFYEWKKVAGGKQPYAIRPQQGDLLAFGGLWDRWENPEGEVVISYSILTTTPNDTVAFVHDRMPVVVGPDRFEAWLTAPADELQDDLKPAPNDLLRAYPVSRDVGSPRNNRPDLLDPVEPAG
ncbi:MAG: SOS response-associated peptidase [Pseudomonadota bacterium]